MDKIARTGDGTVHVRFCRQMHDVRNGVFFDDSQHGGFVAQVHFLKNVFRMPGNFLQIFQMPGVGQAVEIDQPRNFRAVNDVMNHV